MYSSIKSIANKTDVELKEFRALKINGLNIGLESAIDAHLKKDSEGTITSILR